MVETKISEIRYKTDDLKRMRNRYLAERLFRTWIEDFQDESTGEVVSIERNEIILDKGTIIDDGVLQTINFHLQAGDIKEVEVSNQRRIGCEYENTYLSTWFGKIRVDGKNRKYLLYATSLQTAYMILKDHAELNLASRFSISQIKEFENCTVLIDKLKKIDKNEAYLKNDISTSEFILMGDGESDQSNQDDKKFYQIDVSVKDEGEYVSQELFVVETTDVDKAMIVIKSYLDDKEHKRYMSFLEKGEHYSKRDLHLTIEKAMPIQIGTFIPQEFSMAYYSK